MNDLYEDFVETTKKAIRLQEDGFLTQRETVDRIVDAGVNYMANMQALDDKENDK